MAILVELKLKQKRELLKTAEEALADANEKILRGRKPYVTYPPEWEESTRIWRDYCEKAIRQLKDDIKILEAPSAYLLDLS